MILVDSSVWVGAFNENDTHHKRALTDLEEIKQLGEDIIITDYVVVEVSNILLSRVGKKVSERFISAMRESNEVTVMFTGESSFFLTADAFAKNQKALSFVDVSLIVLVKGLGAKLLTYDEELRKAL